MPDIPLNFLNLNRSFNPNAQYSIGNIVAFADAAGTAPVDGTGGSPTVTVTRTLSSPLDGIASILFTKDAANRQGEGMSGDVVLQPSDATKVMFWEFDYQITTGTYTGLPTADISLWVYDITNAVMYQAIPYQLDGTVSTTNQYTQRMQWQVPVGCLQARLIWFLPTTSASAFTVKINNIYFGRDNSVDYAIPVAVLSASSGSYSNATTGFTDVVAAFNVTLSGTRKFKVCLTPTGTSAAVLAVSRTAASADAQFQFMRDGSVTSLFTISLGGGTGVTAIFPEYSAVYDAIAAGTYAFKAQAKVINGTNSETITVTNYKVAVYEL